MDVFTTFILGNWVLNERTHYSHDFTELYCTERKVKGRFVPVETLT